MDRDDLQLILLGLGTLGTFILIFINLPVAISRWSPIFNSLSSIILTWIQNIAIAVFAFVTGWLLKSKLTSLEPTLETEADEEGVPVEGTDDEDAGENILESIEGCIETGETCWRGTASINEDGRVSDTYVSYKAICPRCQTVMYDGENSSAAVATTATTYWDCPSCGHTTVEEYSKYKDAQNLFQTHIQRITESEGEAYSLGNLIENIDGEVTPRAVWEEYAEVVDDEQVSTNCFH